MDITEEDLRDALTGRSGLFAFLQNTLQWPLKSKDANAFPYKEAETQGEHTAIHADVSRLVPITSADTFPIFLVEFTQGFSRSTLRDVLHNIRQEICERAEWDMEEVIFVCAVGCVGIGGRGSGVGEGHQVLGIGHWEAEAHHTEAPSTLNTQHSTLLSGPRTPGCHLGTGPRQLPDPRPPTPDPAYTTLLFVHYEEREGRPQIRSFGWNADEIEETQVLRTAYLPGLVVPWNALDEPDWVACKKTWGAAWSREALTRHFFRDYQRIFEEVCNYYVKGVHGDRTLFTQRLFHRLLFIHCLSKKGWLHFQGRQDYLFALRDAADEAEENFYRDRLFYAFFQGIGESKGPEVYSLAERIERRGDVPTLNIDLFEIADRDDIQRAVLIENEAFDLILERLIGRYNFTLFESTTDDIEVAVDLEMLGRILEKQVTGRHEAGTFYTPPSFITFMCREALKGYLSERTRESAKTIAAFVDQNTGITIRDADTMLNALRAFTCVDPACGSGAYLLRMLQELLALRQCLIADKNVAFQTRYESKLEIIQRNLYGVDKDPFAVQATHFRLWLSLAVDGEVEEEVRGPGSGAQRAPRGPEEDAEVEERGDGEESKTASLDEVLLPLVPDPELTNSLTTTRLYLPSLDFKVVVGDSLICPDPSGAVGQKSVSSDFLCQFDEKKRLYAFPRYTGDKKALLEEIQELRNELATRLPRVNLGFDWRVDFSGVFVQPGEHFTLTGGRPAMHGGFDVVLVNPPNIRHEAIGREYKEKGLKPVFPTVYSSSAELFTYFYVRAVQLLKPGGILAFISSNKWLRAGNGASLRQFLADHCEVKSITDFGNLPVFESASVCPMIFMARKGGLTMGAFFTEVKNLNSPYPDIKALVESIGRKLPENAISGSGWSLTDSRTAERIRIMQAKGIPLGEYVQGKIYRGQLTSLATAYVIDDAKRAELIAADPKSEELIRPLTIGRDIKRWAMNRSNQWLIVLRVGMELDEYPAILKHLNSWEAGPITWQDKGDEGWGSLEIYHQGSYDCPKIYFQEVAASPNFAFDAAGTYINSEILTLPTSDLYVLALLNSKHIWEFLQSACPKLPNGSLTLQASSILSIPIPPASEIDKEALAEIAKMCLEKKGVNVDLEEAELNRRVAVLYGV